MVQKEFDSKIGCRKLKIYVGIGSERALKCRLETRGNRRNFKALS